MRRNNNNNKKKATHSSVHWMHMFNMTLLQKYNHGNKQNIYCR